MAWGEGSVQPREDVSRPSSLTQSAEDLPVVRVVTSGQEGDGPVDVAVVVGQFQQHVVDLAAVGVGCRSTAAEGRDTSAVGVPGGLVERVGHGVQRERWPAAVLDPEVDHPAGEGDRVGVPFGRAAEQCRRSFGHLEQGVRVVGVPGQVAEPGE